MLAILTLVALSGSALELVDSATSARGCPTRLVGDSKHPFHEAQLACDAYLSFALVDELLDGRERAPRVDALARLLDDALVRGQRPFRALPSQTLAGTPVSTSVLVRGWLLVMMAGMARADALPEHRVALFDALAASLVTDLAVVEREGRWLPSFRGGYWPCDSALAASGLVLHGALLDSPSSTLAGYALAARLARTLEMKPGFVTQVDAKGRVVDGTPRGTTLAWTAGFLALGGLDEARAFARALEGFCEPLPFGAMACREHPRGADRPADAVSGPLFMGYGSGASALAIAAFRAAGDVEDARALEALAAMAPAMANVPDVRKKPARYPLENAILLWGASARSWTPTHH